MENDTLIQRAIRQEFAEATILTIAHRLNTIADADKVLVMDAGRLAEFDTPIRLIGACACVHTLVFGIGLTFSLRVRCLISI